MARKACSPGALGAVNSADQAAGRDGGRLSAATCRRAWCDRSGQPVKSGSATTGTAGEAVVSIGTVVGGVSGSATVNGIS